MNGYSESTDIELMNLRNLYLNRYVTVHDRRIGLNIKTGQFCLSVVFQWLIKLRYNFKLEYSVPKL